MAGWAEELQREREEALESFREPQRSPYAAVARADFAGAQPLVLGSAADCDVRLEGAAAHHARIHVEDDRFVLEALDAGAVFQVLTTGSASPPPPPVPAAVRSARVQGGARLGLSGYTLRLSHQNFPALVVLDPRSPRLVSGPPPRWFAPDPALRVTARLVRAANPREEVVLSTRGNKRRALRVGAFELALGGQAVRLTALRLLEPGVGEAEVSVFFRDATTGRESYPVGRYLDPVPVPGRPDEYVLDFNRAYNPSCAFSPLYNCPIPPRENVLAVPVRAGEQDPGGH
jgi:uncharacterized protein (DUF1684 family)